MPARNFSAVPFQRSESPVGRGPSSKTWPRWGFASRAADFAARRAGTAIVQLYDRFGGNGCRKAWPTGARLELRRATEERYATGNATTEPGTLLVPIRTGKGTLGGCLARSSSSLFHDLLGRC